MEYYSSVFTFDDWYLDKPIGTIAQQYDHLSRSLLVAGDLPDGYIWHMLVQCGDNLNIVLMEPVEDATSAVAELPDEDGEPENKTKLIGAVLERDWVGEAGKYSVQLCGIKGDTVRHTNLVTIRIPKSIAGEAQWPEIPSEFTQIEQRVNETYEKVKNTAADAEKAKNAIENMAATVKTVDPDEEASVEKVVQEDGSIRLDFSIPKGENGESAYLKIGTVTTLAPDEEVTAEITGTAPNYVLNLGIPRGQGITSAEDLIEVDGF